MNRKTLIRPYVPKPPLTIIGTAFLVQYQSCITVLPITRETAASLWYSVDGVREERVSRACDCIFPTQPLAAAYLFDRAKDRIAKVEAELASAQRFYTKLLTDPASVVDYRHVNESIRERKDPGVHEREMRSAAASLRAGI